MEAKEIELLKSKLALLEWEKQDRYENPHKYFDLYEWQDDFVHQELHIKTYGVYPHRLYLTCANQVGKTFGGMLLAHKLGTDVEFRKKQWGNNPPRVGWYVLPTQDHINDFYEEKWEPEVLSRGKAKNEGKYAWKVLKKGKDIKGIKFLNTGCTLMFVSLAAKSSSHQGRSVGFVLFDEEPPADKLSEIETRTASFNDPITGLSTAILAFFFTPTSAQDYFKNIFRFQDNKFLNKIPEDLRRKYFWDKQIETFRTCTLEEEKHEKFPVGPTVWKRRVSMFEAQKFKSGRQGRFTESRIRQFINEQPTRRDVLVRSFAAFEKENNGGLIYPHFDKYLHTKESSGSQLGVKKRKGEIFCAGLDYGSGSNHPGGVAICAVVPEKGEVKVLKMWRGEKGKVTSAGDIVDKYLEMAQGLTIDFPFYDHSCADLKTLHWRTTGTELLKAEKSHEVGMGLVDQLFKYNLITIYGYNGEPYLDWAITEFETINHNTPKKDRTDELSDCIRYSLAGISYLFDFKKLAPKDPKAIIKKVVENKKTPEDYGVRSWESVAMVEKKKESVNDYNSLEMEEWGDYFDGY